MPHRTTSSSVHASLVVVLSALAAGGCGADRDEDLPAAVDPPVAMDEDTAPAAYRVDILSASLRHSRHIDGALSISLGGPVTRLVDEVPYTMTSSWFRIDSLHDAAGAPINFDRGGARPHADDPERWPYFHFAATPPLRLQGSGHLDGLPEAAAETVTVKGAAEVIELAQVRELVMDVHTTELPMAFAKIADGAYVALRSFAQDGRSGHINLWTFVSNTGGEPQLDPRPLHLTEHFIEGHDHRRGYDRHRPPLVLGYQLLDDSGGVLGHYEIFGAGSDRSEGLYEELDEPFRLEADAQVGAVRVLVATEFRLLEFPFETKLQSFLD
ncbi:MAG: hypothetical protein HND58_01805 [Planctomycetota bacterium]|nr:MAG: hypothetical protein HND58_01805 [Planctomycetota bacterium]